MVAYHKSLAIIICYFNFIVCNYSFSKINIRESQQNSRLKMSSIDNDQEKHEDIPPKKPESSTSDEPNTSRKCEQDEEKHETDSRFDCNICLDIAKDAVVSFCGHLFCWPCLHQWLDTRPQRQLCPVCKSAISRDKVIPLYGRGGKDNTDPRTKTVPPRPQGQRSEEAAQNYPGMFQWGLGDGGQGVQFSLGIGVFPISFFASFFNLGNDRWTDDRRANQPAQGSRQQAEEQFLSNVFMYIGFAFVLWLLLF